MFSDIVEMLTRKKLTIATMESCTGGALVNAITNIEGAGHVLKYSAVTYSNNYKIKMGVPKEIIEKYSVYSMETARKMSKAIVAFSKSDIGIGITGKLNREDSFNAGGEDNKIFISIYHRKKDEFLDLKLITNTGCTREENKNMIIKEIAKKLIHFI